MATAPLLSIGMIFKNEERCLERCLKSLEPLRKTIPCELIMADTGAEDGSRAIAERYADEVFDFTWIDDFAAARNAVMDRCRGKWYLSIDCDEWLDKNISELVAFVKGNKKVDHAFVTIRNYYDAGLERSESWGDFLALRMARLATGCRYHNTIHETWSYQKPFEQLTHTLLHHDGYVYVDQQALAKKTQRNMPLLRRELEARPDDFLILLQCIENEDSGPTRIQYIQRALKLVQKKAQNWEYYGVLVLRHAVEASRQKLMPGLNEWVRFAKKEFPDSFFVRVDMNFSAFMDAYDAKKWEKALPYGEACRDGIRLRRDERMVKKIAKDLEKGFLYYGTPDKERYLLITLASTCLHLKQAEKALGYLAELPGEKLDPDQVRNATIALTQVHAQTMQDVNPVLTAFYDQVSREEPDKQKQKARLAAFDNIAAAAFTKAYQKEEKDKPGYHRPAYTAFRCLADKCEAGRAAAVMMSTDPAEMHSWLAQVENWQAFPIEALEHVLQAGVAFPLPEKPLPIEVMDGLAAKLTHNDNPARQMALALADNQEYPDLQSLFWAQSLTLAALQTFDWTLGKNDAPVSKFACPEKKKDDAENEKPKDTPETGLALIRKFAQIEAALLPIQYTPQALAEENAALLPPMHRWGLYCALAFEALDARKPQEYLAVLRRGLAACPGQKSIVQFLLDRFMEDARPQTSPEMLMLAEKVKNILAAYDPDDPAVAAIRQSPAYQQVAWLIEDQPGLPVQ